MLLDKQAKLLVFQFDDAAFEPLGEINQFKSLMWQSAFKGHASFELWAPISPENKELLKEGNIIWDGTDVAAKIESIESSVDDQGVELFDVKGRTLEMLLCDRIVWGTYNADDKFASTIMMELVSQHCVNPSDSKREIPWLVLGQDPQIGGKISFQQTGGEIYDSVYNIAGSCDLGFRCRFDPWNKQVIFEVQEGVDRSIEQNVNDPVVLSTDMEDVVSSKYFINIADYKTLAFVHGEGEGSARTVLIAGDNNARGLKRHELYVDARDLQSTVSNEGGGQTELTPAQYRATLNERGLDKLSEYSVIQTFDAEIRTFGEVQYRLNEDYFKGDKITIEDERLGIRTSAIISKVEEDYADKYALILTIGFSSLTVLQKIKQIAK